VRRRRDRHQLRLARLPLPRRRRRRRHCTRAQCSVLWRPERVLGARGARREWSESEFLELGLVGLRKEKVVALGAGGHGVRGQRRTVTSVSGRTDRVRVRNEWWCTGSEGDDLTAEREEGCRACILHSCARVREREDCSHVVACVSVRAWSAARAWQSLALHQLACQRGAPQRDRERRRLRAGQRARIFTVQSTRQGLCRLPCRRGLRAAGPPGEEQGLDCRGRRHARPVHSGGVPWAR
jgi:hypothetical protein